MDIPPTPFHVEDSAAGGPPVLLVHSSGLSGRQWSRLVPALAQRGARVVVPDLTGHGKSAPWPPAAPFSFRVDVAQVTDVLGRLGSAHVVAHSYGGLVALHAALTAPGAVSSLALFDPVLFGSLDRDRDGDVRAQLLALDLLSWNGAAANEADRERWLATFVDFWNGHGAWAALREEAREEFRRVAWVVREGVRSMFEDPTPMRAFGAIASPVLLLTGERSPPPARRLIERLREVIPSARVVTVAGAGHLGPVTHPALVNPILVDAVLGA
jgi:pimeloyl-ACP methyl ester carboxylesterase